MPKLHPLRCSLQQQPCMHHCASSAPSGPNASGPNHARPHAALPPTPCPTDLGVQQPLHAVHPTQRVRAPGLAGRALHIRWGCSPFFSLLILAHLGHAAQTPPVRACMPPPTSPHYVATIPPPNAANPSQCWTALLLASSSTPSRPSWTPSRSRWGA